MNNNEPNWFKLIFGIGSRGAIIRFIALALIVICLIYNHTLIPNNWIGDLITKFITGIIVSFVANGLIKLTNLAQHFFTLIVAVVAIVFVFNTFGTAAIRSFYPPEPCASVTTTSMPSAGIGVIKVVDSNWLGQGGECIGISDGSFAFDIHRPDEALKIQAVEKFKEGDTDAAIRLWREATGINPNDPKNIDDPNDAESLIYLEDAEIHKNCPCPTIIIGTMLTGDFVGIGRDNLQGAYIAQIKYNSSHSDKPLRLLVANAGSQAAYASIIANQIIALAKNDPTIIGVMGWPFSSYTANVIDKLNTQADSADQIHIPMISPSATGDALTFQGGSPYFFRIVPPNAQQAAVAAHYVKQTLHSKRVALFLDPTDDDYSNNLGSDFTQQFGPTNIVATETFTQGQPDTIASALKDALNHAPDLIYFAGYGNDIKTLLDKLPTSGPNAHLPVMGGDALDELSSYQDDSTAQAARFRLHYTAFAFPDERGILCHAKVYPACKLQPFFNEYAAKFDPKKEHLKNPSGFDRPDSDAILAYDAMTVFTTAIERVTSSNRSITSVRVEQAIITISGNRAIQGVSGQISFNANGDPMNKSILVLCISINGAERDRQLSEMHGQFAAGIPVENIRHLNTQCS